MSFSQINSWWQSVLVLGKPVFPYVGLVLVILLAVAIVAFAVYLVYRLWRRFPLALRHLFWRMGILFRRVFVRRASTDSGQAVLARWQHESRSILIEHSFDEAGRRNWFRSPRRMPLPLFAVLGPGKSGKSTLLAAVAGGQSYPPVGEVAQTDTVWWRIGQVLALEISAAIASEESGIRLHWILRCLGRMRPEKPLDGIILAFPVDMLHGAQGAGDGNEFGPYVEAALRICTASEYELPLYVVFTKADKIAGFNDLVRAVGDSNLLRTLILGLPYTGSMLSNEAAKWAKSVPDTVYRQVLGQLLDRPAQDNFRLRGALRIAAQLHGAVPFFDSLVKAIREHTGTNGTPLFRGAFLVGAAQAADSDVEAGRAGATSARLAFVERLATTVLFGEKHVAQALPSRKIKMRRRMSVALACCFISFAVLAFWLPATWNRIDTAVGVLRANLDELSPELRYAGQTGPKGASDLSASSVPRLMRVISVLDRHSVSTGLAPSSWGEATQTRLHEIVGEVAQRLFVLPRATALAREQPHMPQDALVAVVGVSAERVGDLPGYDLLIRFLDERDRLGASSDRGDVLSKGVSYDEFLEFLGTSSDRFKSLKIEWRRTMPYAVTARFQMPGTKDPGVEVEVQRLTGVLWDRLLQEALDFHPIVVLSEDANGTLAKIAGNQTISPAEVQQLSRNLRRLKGESESVSGRRLLGLEKDALAFFSRALERLAASGAVSTGQAVEMAEQLKKRYDAARRKVSRMEWEAVGPVFTQEQRDGVLILSPEVKRLIGGFAGFAAQPFMQDALLPLSPQVQAGQYLEWSSARLDKIGMLADAYREFANTGNQIFESRLRAGMVRIATQSYLVNVESVFRDAVVVRSESLPADQEQRDGYGALDRALQARATNLAAVAGWYRRATVHEGGTASRLSLPGVSTLYAQEVARLLWHFEKNLLEDDPYGSVIEDVSKWIRHAPPKQPLATVFRGNVKERLAASREYLRTQYGNQVYPLLDALDLIGATSTRVDALPRWKRFREVLEGYEKGSMSNGAYEIEHYVLKIAKFSDANECERFIIERAIPSPRSDYFSQRLTDLDETVTRSCSRRITDSGLRKYAEFAAWFNTSVAEHPPFGDLAGAHAAAPPLTLRGFIGALRRYHAFRQQVSADRDGWPEDVTQFLGRMDRLLTQYLAPDILPNGAVNVQVGAGKDTGGAQQTRQESRLDLPLRVRAYFRTRRGDEQGGDNVIDWLVTAGGRQYSHRNSDPTVEWRIGEPVEVTFRWASHAPSAPVLSPLPGGPRIAGRTAVFRYTGDWALFDLMRRHAVGGGEGTPLVLQFAVPTGGTGGRQEARLFISLEPVNDRDAWPPVFPGRAPEISKVFRAEKGL